jgi:hypothetical protein
MASDFSAAWQCLSKRTIGFFVTDQTPCPYPTRSLPTQLWHRCTEWSTVWVSTKPLISEENWPGWGLNPGLPNDTPALYPLLYELMLWLLCHFANKLPNVNSHPIDEKLPNLVTLVRNRLTMTGLCFFFLREKKIPPNTRTN